jgi:hypothetical protein
MRVDYDSQGDTVAITLVDVERADYGDDSVHPQAVVAICDDEPVTIDLIGAGADVRAPLAAVAARYDLDFEALVAAAQSALAAPDRVITLEVGGPASA